NAGKDDKDEDPDIDDLSNILELKFGTNPNSSDTDFDMIPDGYEYYNQLNGTLNDSNDDLDEDGMPNLYEFQNGLNITLNDANLDSDDDGMPNLYEYQNGLLAGLDDDSMDDLDGDGMPNLYEYQNGLQLGIDDSFEDLDNDGLSNLDEFLIGSNPQDSDSDGDGWKDGVEKSWGTDPVLFISNPFVLILLLVLAFILLVSSFFFLRRTSPLIKSSIISTLKLFKGRSWINDMNTGKAIPIDLLARDLDQKSLDIPTIIKNELKRQKISGKIITMQSGILLLESVPPSGINCQVCMSDITDNHHYQCRNCKRFVCIHDYIDLKNVGRTGCPNCSGDLVLFPFTCVACKLDFSSVKELSSQSRCPLCGYDLPAQSELSEEVLGVLKPSELSQKMKLEKETDSTEFSGKKEEKK
ncbi:MAG: hypothetical protein ACXACU_19135, partial [Candidatus Hodarchaeales archaeon]